MADSHEPQKGSWSKAQNRFAWLITFATIGWLGYVLLTSKLFD